MSLDAGHLYVWIDGDDVTIIGSYDPPGRRASAAVGKACITRSRTTAERWRESLSRGELPESSTVPVTREWGKESSAHLTGDGDSGP